MADTQQSIRVKGLARFNRDLGRINKDMQRASRAKMREIAKEVRGTARGLAPVRTGALAQSLRYSASNRGARIVSSLEYAPIHEYGGTIRPRGVPIEIPRSRFVGQAIQQHAGHIEEEIGDLLEFIARRNGFH